MTGQVLRSVSFTCHGNYLSLFTLGAKHGPVQRPQAVSLAFLRVLNIPPRKLSCLQKRQHSSAQVDKKAGKQDNASGADPSHVFRAKAYQRLCLLQGPSLAEKALEAAEALKARTEEAAERAKEGLKSAAGTAREAAQRAAGATQGAAQQAKERIVEGADTTKQTMVQDTERVTSLYRDRPQEAQPGAQQAPAQACSFAARLCMFWQHGMPPALVFSSGGTLSAHQVDIRP